MIGGIVSKAIDLMKQILFNVLQWISNKYLTPFIWFHKLAWYWKLPVYIIVSLILVKLFYYVWKNKHELSYYFDFMFKKI